MHDSIIKGIIFVSGAAVGSVTTWLMVRARYRALADEEIASVKDLYSEKKPEGEEPEKVDNVPEATSVSFERPNKSYERGEKQPPVDYTLYYKRNTITRNMEEKEAPVKEMKKDVSYIIDPDEYSELDDYDLIELNYYADGVLADDGDDIIDDVDNVVGPGTIDTFNEFEAESIYVRNDARKVDYEIVRDKRKYTEVTGLNLDGSESEE